MTTAVEAQAAPGTTTHVAGSMPVPQKQSTPFDKMHHAAEQPSEYDLLWAQVRSSETFDNWAKLATHTLKSVRSSRCFLQTSTQHMSFCVSDRALTLAGSLSTAEFDFVFRLPLCEDGIFCCWYIVRQSMFYIADWCAVRYDSDAQDNTCYFH